MASNGERKEVVTAISASETVIQATFDAFGLEEGKAILDEVVRRGKADEEANGIHAVRWFAEMIEIVAIERAMSKKVKA